jgi:hypothetical protein
VSDDEMRSAGPKPGKRPDLIIEGRVFILPIQTVSAMCAA